MTTLRRLAAACGLAAIVGLGAMASGCDPDGDDTLARQGEVPDKRLVTHRVVPGEATAAGLAYIEAIAAAHADADAYTDAEHRASALRRGLAVPVPAGMAEAEVLQLELAARLAETLATHPDGVPVAIDLLEPMLAPERSLPLDRASARALVTLGDLAVASGDDALAAGSYFRAIRVMSSLRQELER
ncbi:MAG: hypothetical protein K1X88_35635 [Nannocystaceae bacterium]|nr:hypothetical protein [Nannocystaceae bacterium]